MGLLRKTMAALSLATVLTLGAAAPASANGGTSMWFYSGEECMCFELYVFPAEGGSGIPTGLYMDTLGELFFYVS